MNGINGMVSASLRMRCNSIPERVVSLLEPYMVVVGC